MRFVRVAAFQREESSNRSVYFSERMAIEWGNRYEIATEP
jgi:hypothetical protein